MATAHILKYGLRVLGVLGIVLLIWASYMFVALIRYQGTVEDIAFQSGSSVTMRGWFVKPNTPGPHSAVILLHGSGPLSGDHPAVRIFANAFLRSGFAILTYDKRGVGISDGTFNHNDYDAFIEDAVHAVAYLQSRADVDANAIGLLGSSESGWFTPEVASRTGAIAFIVNRAGPPLSWIETNLWEKRHDLSSSGVPNQLVEHAIDLRGRILRFLVKVNADRSLVESAAWQEIEADVDAFNKAHGNDEFWMKQDSVRFGSLADTAAFWSLWQRAIGYDPQPFIEQTEIPMLYVFAENDRNVPTAKSVRYLQSLNAINIEVRIIPGVEHSMLSPAALIYGSHPGFINLIGPWASSKVRN
jgi:pimeloyl-ACP methyl ester carboxylesterase